MSGIHTNHIAFNYFGGKYSILEEVYARFPQPDRFAHLIDLFAGSMAVSLNYCHPKALIKTANELDGRVTNFFRVLRNHEDRLIELLELTPCSEAEYADCWAQTGDQIEDARRFYVRSRMSFYGLGTHRQSKSMHLAKAKANAHGGEVVSRVVNGVPKLREVAKLIRDQYQIINGSYKACIDRFDCPTVFFYADPPYSKRSRRSFNDYRFEFSDDDHAELADRLHCIEGLAMVSGYDCSLMNELYAGWHKTLLPVKQNHIRTGTVQEVLFTNYEPPVRGGDQHKLF